MKDQSSEIVLNPSSSSDLCKESTKFIVKSCDTELTPGLIVASCSATILSSPIIINATVFLVIIVNMIDTLGNSLLCGQIGKLVGPLFWFTI